MLTPCMVCDKNYQEQLKACPYCNSSEQEQLAFLRGEVAGMKAGLKQMESLKEELNKSRLK